MGGGTAGANLDTLLSLRSLVWGRFAANIYVIQPHELIIGSQNTCSHFNRTEVIHNMDYIIYNSVLSLMLAYGDVIYCTSVL